jgi:hypothetical protein
MNTSFDSSTQEFLVLIFKYATPAILGVFGKSFDWSHFIPQRKTYEEYRLEFISSFIAFDINKRHPLLVEQAFKIYFKIQINFEIIQLLLGFKNPTSAFLDYKKARQKIFLNDIGSLEFSKAYSTKFKRKFKIALNLFIYFTFIYVAMVPFFVMWDSDYLSFKKWLLITIWFSIFVYFSALSLIDIEHQNAAERLIKAQPMRNNIRD